MTDNRTDDHGGVLAALSALDAQITKTSGGEPGSGLYGLLDLLAGQFMGIPRTPFIPPSRETDDAGTTSDGSEGDTA